MSLTQDQSQPNAVAAESMATRMLVALSLSHFINDVLQALLPALYPMFKQDFALSFAQIGLITFTFQVSASLLQPLVGLYTDRRPSPYSLAIGMSSTLAGLLLLSVAGSFHTILFASALVGIGSSIFHPEASRVARLASGGRHGFAQSLFQVGGNFGSSMGPLLAAAIVVRNGQRSIAFFSLVALAGIVLLYRIGGWYARKLAEQASSVRKNAQPEVSKLGRGRTILALSVLVGLIFSKYIYLSSLTSYYTFYLIHHFGTSVQQAQVYLFVFLFAVAAGTILGGPVGDRFGRKPVIWISILGVAPFSLLLPQVGLTATVLLTVPIGLILASAFSAIIVYAQELLPGKVGLVAGLFFGLAFGTAGIASALLGRLADSSSIEHVYRICSYLPLIGLITAFLPDIEPRHR